MVSVAEIVRHHRERIIDLWLERARKLRSARGLSHDELVDTLPAYLDALAAHRPDGEKPEDVDDLSVTHLGVRLRQGYALDDTMAEYGTTLRMLRSARRRTGSGVVEQVLNHAIGAIANRIRAGEPLPLQLDRCVLGALAHEVVDEMTAAYGDRFDLHVAPDVVGVWDARELKRIIWNLASNGVKHGSAGARIRISVVPEPAGVAILVWSAGPPLASDQREAIFEPFARGANAAATRGWGLGLALVKGAAEAHGGHVDVAAHDGGNEFAVHLPWNAAEAHARLH